MNEILKSIPKGDVIIAVLDPPRAGVPASVIRAIRDCKLITHVIFVACALKNSMQNFVDLARPTSNKFPGFPFKPEECVVVDLFPHTELCEVVVSWVRVTELEVFGLGKDLIKDANGEVDQVVLKIQEVQEASQEI